MPKNLQPKYTDEPKTDLFSAAAEAKLVYGQVIEEVLRKTGNLTANADKTFSEVATANCRSQFPVFPRSINCRDCFCRNHLITHAVLAGLKATDVDILVTNTSIYCPTPSIASLVINLFKMREDVQAYHLGGMGCAMGVVGLNLVRDLLAVS